MSIVTLFVPTVRFKGARFSKVWKKIPTSPICQSRCEYYFYYREWNVVFCVIWYVWLVNWCSQRFEHRFIISNFYWIIRPQDLFSVLSTPPAIFLKVVNEVEAGREVSDKTKRHKWQSFIFRVRFLPDDSYLKTIWRVQVLGIIWDCYLLSGKMSCLRPSGKDGKVFLWKQDSTSMVRKGMVKIIGNTGVSVTNAHMSTETGESIQHRFRAGNQLPDRFPNNAEHGGVALVSPCTVRTLYVHRTLRLFSYISG
jgi:hypothetical protein